MILNQARILTCPHCGAKKEVLSLLSGNMCSSRIWSDTKIVAPMLPNVSSIQECPNCGKFFLLSRQKEEYGEDYSWEKGELSYLKLKEAWKQLATLPDLTENERYSSLIMLVWAFNDEYTRLRQKDIPTEEHDYIVSIVDLLLALDSVDNLLKAELLREIGRFDEAIKILNAYRAHDDFLKGILVKCKVLVEDHITRPFVIC